MTEWQSGGVRCRTSTTLFITLPLSHFATLPLTVPPTPEPTMFSTDRDLLILEPNLFRDAGFAGQHLVTGTGDIAAGVLTLTAQDNDFAAESIDAGHIAVVDGTPYEVLARLSSTTVSLSRLRPSPDDAALPPSPVTGKPVRITTFAPQLAQSHRIILRMLGIEPDDPPIPGRITESNITNPGALRLAESLHALSGIFFAAAAGYPGGVTGAAFSIWQRAQMYRDRFESERQSAAAHIDTDGDGVPDATRRLNVIQLIRA